MLNSMNQICSYICRLIDIVIIIDFSKDKEA